MWILHWFPDSFISFISQTIALLGLSLYAFSKVAKWIPTICRFILAFEIVGVMLFGIGAYLYGGYGVEKEWRQRVTDLQEKLKESETKSKETNTVIEREVVEKVKVVKEKQEVIKKEIELKREIINQDCTLDNFIITIYNKSLADPWEDDKNKK
jgi:hypothetical protein